MDCEPAFSQSQYMFILPDCGTLKIDIEKRRCFYWSDKFINTEVLSLDLSV